MKRFEELFAELQAKAAAGDPASGTVRELAKGTHGIGKKVIEEAGEVWMAAEYEGKERTAKGEGLLARAFCHEIDHLNGVLFTDNVIRMLED